MEQGHIDLHVHTTASDGTLSPAGLVTFAREKGLRAVAVTDHDTVEGLSEALAEAAKRNFEVVPGVEISVDYHGGEMHILGYYVDPGSKPLLDSLEQLQEYRLERNPKVIRKLRELGMHISLEEVTEAAGGNVIGRPHFAAVLVRKGYVADTREAFDKYLGSGQPAYVKKEKLTPAEGIELILKAGGVPVLAHPKYIKDHNPDRMSALLEKLKKAGLKGVEAYYTTHTSEETALYLRLAQQHSLLVTGGTDFHGANKPEIELGTGTGGNLKIPYELLTELKKVVERT